MRKVPEEVYQPEKGVEGRSKESEHLGVFWGKLLYVSVHCKRRDGEGPERNGKRTLVYFT